MKEELNKLGFNSVKTLTGHIHIKSFDYFDLVIEELNGDNVVSLKEEGEIGMVKEIVLRFGADLEWVTNFIKLFND